MASLLPGMFCFCVMCQQLYFLFLAYSIGNVPKHLRVDTKIRHAVKMTKNITCGSDKTEKSECIHITLITWK